MTDSQSTQSASPLVRAGWLLLLVTALTMGSVGCGNAKAEEGHDAERHDYQLSMEAGHVHIFSDSEVTFTVRDLEDCSTPDDLTSCSTVSGLPVVAYYRSGHGAEARTQELDGETLVDNGNGTYTWKRDFNTYGAYTLGMQFTHDGQHYSDAFPMATSKAGGERFFCDSDGDSTDDRAFQIRWHASDGHMHAGGGDVDFSFELMRSFNDDINTDEPWTNLFNHLRPAELEGNAPTVELMQGEDGDATVVETLPAAYTGKGIYQVSQAFTEDMMGDGDHGGDFWMRVSFTDDLGCTVSSASAVHEFHFSVAIPH